jgi:hypothetical protein
MYFDCAKLYGIEQRHEIAADDARLGTFFDGLQRFDTDSIWDVRSRVLLEKDRAAHPIGEALEHEWPTIHVWLENRPDARIVAHQCAFGVASFWEIYL